VKKIRAAEKFTLPYLAKRPSGNPAAGTERPIFMGDALCAKKTLKNILRRIRTAWKWLNLAHP
jgi:hypothetical protein